MKKTVRRALAMILALSALVLCFASCGASVTKLNVTVAIYGLDKDVETIWLGRHMQVEEGKTADDAVAQLKEMVSTLTYQKDTSGMYTSFKNGSDTLKIPQSKTIGDVNQYYHLGWRLNGEVQSQIDNPKKMSDHVLVEGDTIEIFIQMDELKAN